MIYTVGIISIHPPLDLLKKKLLIYLDYKALPRSPFFKSDPASVLLLPTYRQNTPPVVRIVHR